MAERKGSRDVPSEAPEKSFVSQEYLQGLSADDEATSVSHVGCKESKRSLVSVPRSFRVRVRVRVRIIQMSAFP